MFDGKFKVGKKTFAIVFAVLLIAVIFSGCFENKEKVTTDEIKQEIFQAIVELTSYKYSANGTVIYTRVNETGILNETEIYNLDSKIDIINKKNGGKNRDRLFTY